MVPVIHCPMSHGVIFEEKEGWKISFTGDNYPNKNFIKQANGSTILIHEATFHPKLKENAKNHLHSTFEDAWRVGM